MDNITKIRVSNPTKIFVYDTQEPILHHMSNSLEKSHISTVRYTEKHQIIDSISKENPKLIIIGPSVQKINAIDLSLTIRKMENFSSIGIIYVVHFDQSKDDYMVVGENIDFVYSPIMHNKLVEVTKQLIRTSKQSSDEEYVSYRDIKFYQETGEIRRDDGKYAFIRPGLEAKILEVLMRDPKAIYSREDLIKSIWIGENRNEISPRTVDVHINRLRRFLKENIESADLINTVRSQGYCIDPFGRN